MGNRQVFEREMGQCHTVGQEDTKDREKIATDMMWKRPSCHQEPGDVRLRD